MTRVPLRSLVLGVALAGGLRPAGAGELRGRFFLGDRPVAGVTVSVVPYENPLEVARREARRLPPPQPIANVMTGADGSYVLAVPAGSGEERLFTVCAEGGGAVAAAFAGFWGSSETTDVGDHALVPGARLAGKVTDAAGAPLANAEVVLVPQVDRTWDPELEAVPRRTMTGADGTFHFEDASATANGLRAEKPGLLAAQQVGVRARQLPAPIVLAAGAPVTGLVRKTDGKSPAAGALVRLEGRVTTRWVEAGADGAFTIANAPAGTVTAVADAGEAGFLEQGAVKLPLVQGTTLVLVLQPSSALVGRTVDARTGRPVPRTRVEVHAGGKSRTARSGPDGFFGMRGLPSRSWQLRADEPRYVPWTHANVPVWPGETKKLDIPLVLGASLSGRVTDENNQPVANARGSLSQMGAVSLPRLMRRIRGDGAPTFRTRSDGTFQATRLVPGESQFLTVSHPDFELATLGGLSLLPGATKAGVAIVLKRGSTLTGLVKDPDGQPIPGAEVALSQPFVFGPGRGGGRAVVSVISGASADTKGGTTGSDGMFSIRGVAPGEYALTIKRSGYATEHIDPVKVPEDGAPAPLEVTLKPGVVISGHVVRHSGAGAEGYNLSAVPPGRPRFGGSPISEQRTGADGAFTLDGLTAGQSYDLQLFGPTGPGEGKRGVVAPASDVEITVAGLGRITGTVLDARDGHPLSDFQVTYEPDRGGGGLRGGVFMITRGAGGGTTGGPGQPVAVHSPNGTFTLEDVPAGTWSLVVTAKGYQQGRTAGVEVEKGATHESVEVRMPRGAVLKGHVADALTGAAVSNAAISLIPPGSAPALAAIVTAATDGDVTTDADGHFEMEGVATGKQALHVTHPDYTDATQTVEVADAGATVEVRLTQGGVVAGVVASDTGQPVAGANVALSQAGSGGFGLGGGAGAQANITDAAGRFRFDHLGAGRYTATASLGSHTSTPVEVVLQAGQSQPAVTLQLQLGVTIQGTVSGLPDTMISGMTVTASGADSYIQSTHLGADASFEFDNVPAGVVTLRGTATDPTGSTRTATKQVTASADQPVVTVQLVFDQGFTLSGRVTQAGQPVAGATIFASLQGGGGRQASSVTDGGGSYQLTGLQEGTYTVNAMAAVAGTSSSRRQTIALTSDQTLDIAFPSAKVGGQVVDADGNIPLANATVSIASRDPGATGGAGQRAGTTDSNGQFSFAGLDEGTYTLTTSRPDYQLDKRDADGTDQGGAGLVIALKRGAGIGIKVQDGLSGVPLPGVMVRVSAAQGTPVFGPSPITLDGNGQGEIPSLPPGTYTLIAGASGYAPIRLDGVTVPSPVVTISLTPGGSLLIQAGPKTLAAGTATGSITTTAGQPALLSLLNLQGRIAISEPNLQLRNVPPGSYVLLLPAAGVSQAFAVSEGAPTTVQLP